MSGNLSRHDLADLLDYDQSSGMFVWKRSPCIRNVKGRIAGCRTSHGYWQIRINGRSYLAHRLAWLFVHGEWPQHQIDHIDGDRCNNRLGNLRDVPLAVNRQNIKGAMAGKKIPILGVRSQRSRFSALITLNGRRIYLGSFGTTEEAHRAYLSAKRRIHVGNTL